MGKCKNRTVPPASRIPRIQPFCCAFVKPSCLHESIDVESSTVGQTKHADIAERDEMTRRKKLPPERARPRHRGIVLGKMLFVGDLAAAALAAGFAVLIHAEDLDAAVTFIGIVALLWPLTAFSIGLYRSEQLASWASTVSDLPRGFVAMMLMTWPIYGAGELTGFGTPVSRHLHHDPRPRRLRRPRPRPRPSRRPPRSRPAPADPDPGLGHGRRPSGREDPQQPQFGLIPVGIVDDEVHDIGTPDLPWLGRFSDLAKIIEMQNIDRVIIAFSRVSHEELLEAIRACRDAVSPSTSFPACSSSSTASARSTRSAACPCSRSAAPALTSTVVAAKRVLDVVGSLALIVFFPPLMIATAIAIKLESRGPDLLPPAPRRPRQQQLQPDQVPLHVRRRRAAEEGAR